MSRVPLQKWQKIGLILGGSSAVLFVIAQQAPQSTERFYSRGLFPFLGNTLSWLTGLVPFSLTDLTHLLIPVCLLAAFAVGFRSTPKPGRFSWRAVGFGAVTAVALAGYFYSAFLFLWGFNYARAEFKSKIEVSESVPVPLRAKILAEAAGVTKELRSQLSTPNGCFEYANSLAELDTIVLSQQRDFFSKLKIPYVGQGPAKPRLLSSLWLKLGNSGIYGPFTGEANVSFPMAPGMAPFILAHERAHSNGFASETDANLIAFLTVWSSPEPRVQYSGWLAFWSYVPDSERAAAGLSANTVADLLCVRRFWQQRSSLSATRFVNQFYGTFLKMQGQRRGIHTYQEAAAILLKAFAENGVPAHRDLLRVYSRVIE